MISIIFIRKHLMINFPPAKELCSTSSNSLGWSCYLGVSLLLMGTECKLPPDEGSGVWMEVMTEMQLNLKAKRYRQLTLFAVELWILNSGLDITPAFICSRNATYIYQLIINRENIHFSVLHDAIHTLLQSLISYFKLNPFLQKEAS